MNSAFHHVHASGGRVAIAPGRRLRWRRRDRAPRHSTSWAMRPGRAESSPPARRPAPAGGRPARRRRSDARRRLRPCAGHSWGSKRRPWPARRAQHLQPGQRRHAPRRHHQATPGHGRFEGAPKTDERTERKRHQAAILRLDAGGIEHILPTFEPPLPILGRVEHRHRPAARARRLMEAHIVLVRKSQVRGQGSKPLVGLQFFLEREGPLGRSRRASGAAHPLRPGERNRTGRPVFRHKTGCAARWL